MVRRLGLPVFGFWLQDAGFWGLAAQVSEVLGPHRKPEQAREVSEHSIELRDEVQGNSS